MEKKIIHYFNKTILIMTWAFLSACGGGGGDNNDPNAGNWDQMNWDQNNWQ